MAGRATAGRRTWSVIASLVAVVVAACTGGSDPAEPAASAAPDGGAVRVVATTSILGDLTSNVLGDEGSVEVIIDAGTDPHAFEASAGDIATIRDADLVVANGLDLETSLLDALAAAEEDGVPVLHVAEHVDPLPFGDAHGDAHSDEGGHTEEEADHGEFDPHFWLDPRRVATAVDVIAERLTDVTPPGADAITANAEAYRAEVLALDAEVEDTFAAIPDDRRALVTNHDAFGYLAARYGFEVVGTVIPGGSTLAEPSARELAQLAATIEETGVPAIFTENIAPPRVVETVSREVGRDIEVVQLYSDALGDEASAASTYLELVRTNAQRIVEALGR